MRPLVLRGATVMTGIATMEDCSVLVENGRISDVFGEKRFRQKTFGPETLVIDCSGLFVAPGFIDTHIHGFGGFGTEDSSADAVVAMSEALAQRGVTAFCPTLYPMESGALLEAVRAASSAMGRERGARIMGLHLEGPFLSPERLGVQRPETLKPVDLDYMDELWRASEGRISNMTVAPELKGMRELALSCAHKGIVLQAGHTNASYEHMVEGMQAGILHATHLWNAMSQMHHRNPNAVGAVLIHPEFSCEIIADGQHVHPDLVRLLVRDKPIDRIVLVTDALKPTGQAEGPLVANGEEVYLEGGVFHRKADDVIAGSALTMAVGVRKLVSWGLSMSDAVRTASTNPAQVLRFPRKGYLLPGYDADLVVFDGELDVKLSVAGGAILKDSVS